MWRPSCSLEVMQARAALLSQVRQFFQQRNLLEVQTALLSRTTVTDPHLQSMSVQLGGQAWYLQTSPEHQMKRLLCAGAPGIYQICSGFRDEEHGRLHNPEFTLLEWYRPDFSLAQLMAEVTALVAQVLPAATMRQLTYARLFEEQFGVNPHLADSADLLLAAQQHLGEDCTRFDSGELTDLLFDRACERLSGGVFITDYPIQQAALARSKETPQGIEVAERFELVIEGLEIANGYLELLDADVAVARMQDDLDIRARKGLPQPEKDSRLLHAMAAGLPDCSGVALGFDRLLMLQLGKTDISEVLNFPYTRA